MKKPIPLILALLFVAGCDRPVAEIQPGEHIVLLGNALPDRMQHDGWLETYLQAALPDHQLVIRNHGFSGDRVDHRPRSEGFPSADDYLGLSQATTIFAMFGYNESFDDDPAGYGNALSEWIEHTREQDYSGQGPPDIVLFSPIAHEDLDDPNVPDGSENNARLARYAEATRAVAEAQGLGYVDLFTASQGLYGSTEAPLTINGVHLNDEGNRRIAEVILRRVTGQAPSEDEERLASIRTAVLDKNLHWHNRYRATDGNDVWGTRSTLAFTDGQTNYDVLQNELIQLDYMTANRDHVIWAAAQGESISPDDSNVPPPVEVISNLDEPQEQGGVSKLGTLDFLSAEEGIDRMTLEPGLRANVFASEEMFPELVNPVQLGVDTRGRMWAATWGTYPKWEPTGEMNDRLLILPDDDRDGVADRAITFAYVHNPTGFEFWNGGVIVASVPDLLFLKDTDGDDVADVRIRLMGGLGSADTHHSANNFVYGPDGFLYYQRGIFNVSNVESPWSANQESRESGMYRFNPRTHEFSFHAINTPNPHGTSFDYWGYHYATDATGGAAFQVKSNRNGTFEMRSLLEHTVRPVPSSGIISSAHLPPRMEGNFIILNVIAFLGIKQYTLEADAVTGDVTGTETSDLLVSSDPNFRPTDFEIGDDGALYVADWANAIIGHMQHNIRDPARDDSHGRIYRLSAPARALQDHVDIDGQPIPVLLTALQHPVNGIRHRARIELSERPTDEVIAETEAWMAQWDPGDPGHAHHLLEALWVHQQHNVENQDLLELVLNSPVPDARIAARRVERMWENSAAAPVRISDAEGDERSNERPDLGSDAIVVKTVVEEMRYDVTSFTVAAGQDVTLLFDNEDYTPHNLVIGHPRSGETIGAAADALGVDGFAKRFIPERPEIIVASDLLNHGTFQVLTFTAPTEPGEYDVLCTFPGHRGTMHGTMTVEG
ncbi:MAG: GDSL-type esterase/lipase family protein [Gemmatimonadota bacterium]|nr:GDSL-type esterase/lipase family protein [Gemmatimonadota bacterium]MDE3013680.1 GDSL-type esterase/lipase family protein [Gemmatimonadota bacterium]